MFFDVSTFRRPSGPIGKFTPDENDAVAIGAARRLRRAVSGRNRNTSSTTKRLTGFLSAPASLGAALGARGCTIGQAGHGNEGEREVRYDSLFPTYASKSSVNGYACRCP